MIMLFITLFSQGTHEVGGLTVIQALEIIRGCRGMNIIGGDLVEVCSPPLAPSVLYWPRGGYSQNKWVGVRGLLPKTLTLFMTRLQANLQPKSAIFATLFMTY